MIKLMKNTFYKENKTKEELCKFILKSERLSMGFKCEEFENKFSIYQGRKYSVLFNSGSSANLALIQSLCNLGRLKKGDNVGFSALTWATNVMPLIQLDLNPIPVDISLKNLNVNLENIRSINENLKALFITNLLGFCGDLDKIEEYCKKNNIILLEDNCESLGSRLNGKKLGNFGLASTFSFFVGHHLSTIEGGMVCTDDEELHDMLLMVRAHGWSRNLDKKNDLKMQEENKIDPFYNQYTFYTLGYNLRPTEITGFLGIEQLKYIDEMNRIRQNNFKEFNSSIKENLDCFVLELGNMDFVSNFAFPLVFRNYESFKKIKSRFEKDVEIRPIVGGNIVLQPFFKDYLHKKNKVYNCPNAEKAHRRGFYFPNNPELDKKEKEIIINLLKGEI